MGGPYPVLVTELETSSPAAALPAGGSLVHRHRTIHIVGDKTALDAIARKALGASLDAITSALVVPK